MPADLLVDDEAETEPQQQQGQSLADRIAARQAARKPTTTPTVDDGLADRIAARKAARVAGPVAPVAPTAAPVAPTAPIVAAHDEDMAPTEERKTVPITEPTFKPAPVTFQPRLATPTNTPTPSAVQAAESFRQQTGQLPTEVSEEEGTGPGRGIVTTGPLKPLAIYKSDVDRLANSPELKTRIATRLAMLRAPSGTTVAGDPNNEITSLIPFAKQLDDMPTPKSVAGRAALAAGRMLVHPINTATGVITAPGQAAYDLTTFAMQEADRHFAEQEGLPVPERTVDPKKAAFAAGQLLTLGVASKAMPLLEAAFGRTMATEAATAVENGESPGAALLKGYGKMVAAHTVIGGAAGATFSPDDPMTGAIIGAALGGVHAATQAPSVRLPVDARPAAPASEQIAAGERAPKQGRATTPKPSSPGEPDYTVESPAGNTSGDVRVDPDHLPFWNEQTMGPKPTVEEHEAFKQRAVETLMNHRRVTPPESAAPAPAMNTPEEIDARDKPVGAAPPELGPRKFPATVSTLTDFAREQGISIDDAAARLKGANYDVSDDVLARARPAEQNPEQNQQEKQNPPTIAADLPTHDIQTISNAHDLRELATGLSDRTGTDLETAQRTIIDRMREHNAAGLSMDDARKAVDTEFAAPEPETKATSTATRLATSQTGDNSPSDAAATASPATRDVPVNGNELETNAAKEGAKTEESPSKHDYSSTQFNLPAEHAKAISDLAAKIPDGHLAEDGRETTPHVTVKYGLHGDDPEKVRALLKDQAPIPISFGKTSMFPANESGKADVVKVDVDSPELHALNRKIADALPHTDTHPGYKPHATVAYVKPGEGQQYVGDASMEGKKALLSHLTFSDKNGNATEIPLSGASPATPATEVPTSPESAQARLASGRLQSNLTKVKAEDLLGELRRLYDANNEDGSTAVPSIIEDTHMDHPEGKPYVGMKGAAIKASGRIAARKKSIAKIETELRSRGYTDESLLDHIGEPSDADVERMAMEDEETSASKEAVDYLQFPPKPRLIQKPGAKPAPQKPVAITTEFDTPRVTETRQWTKDHENEHTALIDTPERNALRQRIADQMYGSGASVKARQFTYWIGLPASGKSGLAEAEAAKTGALLLDTDKAKPELPEYDDGKGTSIVHVEASRIRNIARDRAIAANDNIVLPTVGHDLGGLTKEITALKAAGWTVNLRFADLDARKAASRAVARYGDGGIFVDPAYILSIATLPEATYTALKDNAGVATYARFDTDTPRGTPPRLIESGEHSGGSRGGSAALASSGRSGEPRISGESQGVAEAEVAVPPPGEESPAETSESPEEATGIKNAVNAEERAKLGMGERSAPEPRTQDQMYEAGKALDAADPTALPRLLKELEADPEKIVGTKTEAGLLLKHRVDLDNSLKELLTAKDRAVADKDGAAEQIARAQLAVKREEIKHFIQLAERTGTATGRALAARRMMSHLDYSLSNMEAMAEAAKGAPLTEDELTSIKGLYDELQVKLRAAEKDVAEANERAANAEADLHHAKLREEGMKPLMDRVAKRLETSAAAAKKRIRERGLRAMAGMDPEELADHAILGAAELAKGAVRFADWSASMTRAMGDAIRPHLREIFDASNERLNSELAAERTTSTRKGGTEKSPLPDVRARMQKRVEDGIDDLNDLQPYLRQLALDHIRAGITDREPLLDALHADVKNAGLDVGRSEVRDALSGYGNFKPLDKAADKQRLREIQAESQKLAQLEALEKGQAPRASGFERPAPSDETRRLTQQVNEAKKKAGIVTGPDDATRLKSALASAKTRTRNAIKDLQTEIDTGQRTVSGERVPISDPELEVLKTQLAELRKVETDVFGKREMTDAQRLTLAIAAARRTAATWSDRVGQARAGKFGGPTRSKLIGHPELEALRAKAKAAREQYHELKSLGEIQEIHPLRNPRQKVAVAGTEGIERSPEGEELTASDGGAESPLTARSDGSIKKGSADQHPDELARRRAAAQNQAYRTRLAEREADLRDRMAREDYSPRPLKPGMRMDRESIQRKADVETVKQQYQAKIRAFEKSNRPLPQKIADRWVSFVRFGALSWPSVIGKLSSVAISRIITTPVTDAVALGVAKALPRLAEGAPRYGTTSARTALRAEIAGQVGMWVDGVRSSGQLIRNQRSRLELLHGKDKAPPEIADYMGRLHAALKEPIKEAEYARSLYRRTEAAALAGEEVAGPAVQLRLSTEAYLDAERAVSMNNNVVNDGFKALLRRFAQPDKATGKPDPLGVLLSTALKTEMPVMKAPTNVVLEASEIIAGLPIGGARAAWAYAHGIEDLTPVERDSIIRMIAKGAIGLAIMALYFYKHDQVEFGGFYQSGEKRTPDDVPAGGARIGGIGGTTIPASLLHNPFMAAGQFAASIARVAPTRLRKSDEDPVGYGSALMAASFGLLDETPLLGAPHRDYQQLSDPKQRDEFLAKKASSLLVPGMVQWVAKATDDDVARKPVGLIQHIKADIPGLRKDVPVAIAKPAPAAMKSQRPIRTIQSPKPLRPLR